MEGMSTWESRLSSGGHKTVGDSGPRHDVTLPHPFLTHSLSHSANLSFLLVEKSRASYPGGRFPSSFIHQAHHHGLNKLGGGGVFSP